MSSLILGDTIWFYEALPSPIRKMGAIRGKLDLIAAKFVQGWFAMWSQAHWQQVGLEGQT